MRVKLEFERNDDTNNVDLIHLYIHLQYNILLYMFTHA